MQHNVFRVYRSLRLENEVHFFTAATKLLEDIDSFVFEAFFAGNGVNRLRPTFFNFDFFEI